MNRYPMILLIVLAFCMPNLMAERPDWAVESGYTYIEKSVTKGEKDTLDDVKAQYKTMLESSIKSYGDDVKAFGNQYVKPYNADAYNGDANGLVSAVDTYVASYKGDTASDFNITAMNKNVADYLSMAKENCGDINGLLTAADTSTKQTYGQNVKEIVQFFMEDVKNNKLFAAADYAKDFDLLKEYVKNRITKAKELTTQTRHNFEPSDYLDKGVPNVTRDRVQVALDHDGVSNQYSGMTLNNLMQYVSGKFGDGDLSESTNWFSKSWGSELDVTMFNATDASKRVDALHGEYSAVTNNLDYGREYEIREGGNVLAMNLSEYGNLTTDGVKLDKDSDGKDVPVKTEYLLDGLYNNRHYGFRNGTYNTVSVTVGSRKYQLYDQFYTSPLVLDLDGDGKLEASKGEWLPHKYDNSKLVEFDIDGDQFLELTEWVGANDGILLVGYEKGKEVNANHMFGEAGGYKNGFEKLSLFDTNGDKKISGDELKTLFVWQDRNNNAKVDDGEVTPIADLGITELSLTHEQLASSFVMKGENRKMWDWYPTYFRIKNTK